MTAMHGKSGKGNNQKCAKFIAPGRLAKDYGNSQKPSRLAGNGIARTSRSISRTQTSPVKGQEPQPISNDKTFGGISSHTLLINFGEKQWKEEDFTEESCFLDILKLCKKFIDIYSIGLKITDGDGRPLRDDRDLLAMMEAHEYVKNIDIYVEVDKLAQPLQFKIPEDNPTYTTSMPRVPKVTDVRILGDKKTNTKVTARGNVMDGSEQASIVQFFMTDSRNFNEETGLQAISECTINKEFQIPLEAVGHYLVVKFSPMTEDGESGQPRYAITEEHVKDNGLQENEPQPRQRVIAQQNAHSGFQDVHQMDEHGLSQSQSQHNHQTFRNQVNVVRTRRTIRGKDKS